MRGDIMRDTRVAFLVARKGVEQIELTDPWEALTATGATPQLVSTRPGTIQAFHHLDRADTFPVDQTVNRVTADDFDALVLPGGVANPDFLRMHAGAVDFTRGFFDAGKPVAAICHAPWTLIEADVLRGRRLTSWPSLRTDIRNAGGEWADEPAVVCGNGPNTLVTSRGPDDLKFFDEAMLEAFAGAGSATP
jgi:protease I